MMGNSPWRDAFPGAEFIGHANAAAGMMSTGVSNRKQLLEQGPAFASQIHEAIAKLRKAKAMDSPAFVSAWLAYAYGASGDRAAAIAEAEDLKAKSLRHSVTPFNMALVTLGLGDRERALNYLEQAYAADSQWLGWLKLDKAFDPLRSEPRFMALLKKLRFDK